MSIASILVTGLFGLTVLGGSFYLLVAIVAMWRSPDALTRLNQLSAGIMVGVPLLIISNVILEAAEGELTFGKGLTAVVAIAAIMLVATVASEVLGRAVLGARDGSAEDYVKE